MGQVVHLSQGHELGQVELLFDKIEDGVIEAQIAKLQATRATNDVLQCKVEPIAEPITFDDFTKLDIRVGTVLECVKVPKADKLLHFTIDDGIGRRSIVSGIAQHYNPEALIGKQVCFIANLPPRKLKGIESQGMILSAQDADGSLRVVTLEAYVAPGSRVG